MSDKTKIAKAIIQVINEVKGIEKNSNVGAGRAGSYKGTKDQDVKLVFKKALASAGLCMLPIDIEESTQIDRWEETNQYGTKQKQSVFTKAKVKYMLLHESGESIELCGYGHGVDSQDKGAGKATTYAMKYALLYTFLTPVGDIDDADETHSNEITTPKKSEPKQKLKLSEHPDKWSQAVKYLKNGGALEDITKKYTLTEKEQTKLIDDCNG